MTFRGTFDYSLDAKNRLTIPPRFRTAFSDGLILVPQIEPCVAIWRLTDYESLVQSSLSGMNAMSPQAREMRRLLFANAHDAELDSAGRVGIPPRLMKHGALTKDVKVTGVGEWLEIWDADAWTSYSSDLTARGPQLTADLGTPA